jgi:hypothetical protein
MCRAVGHHRIVPFDEGLPPVVPPLDIPVVAFLGRLEHEALPGNIAFVFPDSDPPAPAAKMHPTVQAEAHQVQGTIGPRGKPLGQHRIHWSAIQEQFKPFTASCSAYEGYAGAPSQRPKGALVLLLLRARNGPREPPRRDRPARGATVAAHLERIALYNCRVASRWACSRLA